MKNDGSMTMEAVFGALLITLILVVAANMISVSTARNQVSQRVEVLAVQTSLNGGLLQSDLDAFLAHLEDAGYDAAGTQVSVSRVIPGGLSGSYILSSAASSYISILDEDNQIHMSVTIPYKEGQIFSKVFEDFETMRFERRLISRRE